MTVDNPDAYKHSPGDCFVYRSAADDPDSDEYWIIHQRIWTHDPNVHDHVPSVDANASTDSDQRAAGASTT